MSKRHNPAKCTDELCTFCDGYEWGCEPPEDADPFGWQAGRAADRYEHFLDSNWE